MIQVEDSVFVQTIVAELIHFLRFLGQSIKKEDEVLGSLVPRQSVECFDPREW